MNFSFMMLFFFFLSLMNLALQRNHILMTLLSLEFLTLTLTLSSIYFAGQYISLHTFIFSIILTFGATEASLGLALLTTLTRKMGSDHTSSLTMSKC